MQTLLKNKAFLFLAKFLLLFILWYVVYELWLHPQGGLDRLVINNSIFFTKYLLELLGYESFTNSSETIRVIGIDGTHGIWIGDPCNGLSLFALFTGFILAYPGPVKHKLWYIPAGILAIHILNIIRVLSLTLIVYHAPEHLDFNHTYTFTIFVYGFIFLFWLIWVNRFSKLRA